MMRINAKPNISPQRREDFETILLLLNHPAKFKSGRRFTQIFADKSKESALISVYLRPIKH
ncbi:MAG: hypothetical protein K8R89_07830, partial [Anaerolineae bacterium]|nr:hypothetical protein [Anaerolineae bacterium]